MQDQLLKVPSDIRSIVLEYVTQLIVVQKMNKTIDLINRTVWPRYTLNTFHFDEFEAFPIVFSDLVVRFYAEKKMLRPSAGSVEHIFHRWNSAIPETDPKNEHY